MGVGRVVQGDFSLCAEKQGTWFPPRPAPGHLSGTQNLGYYDT